MKKDLPNASLASLVGRLIGFFVAGGKRLHQTDLDTAALRAWSRRSVVWHTRKTAEMVSSPTRRAIHARTKVPQEKVRKSVSRQAIEPDDDTDQRASTRGAFP